MMSLNNDGRSILWDLMVIADAAAHRLSDGLKQRHDKIPWRDIRGFRNWAAHVYDELDLEVVRSIVEDDLPALKLAAQSELT